MEPLLQSGVPTTEAVDPATVRIDELGSPALAQMLVGAQRGAVDAALAAVDPLAAAIDAVAAALAGGHRIWLFGAGTSGRLAVLDTAELPPTFGLDPAAVQACIAGGDAALRTAVEGAEDDGAAGACAADECQAGDVAIGVSASGGAPYVVAALSRARERGSLTVGIANALDSVICSQAAIAVVLATGAEPIAGSTRLRAGTAQKIALNTISTGAMIRLGKTYGNRMVDVVATNAKLRARAVRLVREIAGDVDAAGLLAAAGGSVKTAIVMARLDCSRMEAERRLADVQGHLRALLDEP